MHNECRGSVLVLFRFDSSVVLGMTDGLGPGIPRFRNKFNCSFERLEQRDSLRSKLIGNGRLTWVFLNICYFLFLLKITSRRLVSLFCFVR